MGIFYKNNNIHNKFIGFDEDDKVWDYTFFPLSKQCGSGVFYSQEWGIVDEAQKYTTFQKCRANVVYSQRWVLLEKMFDEPFQE